jgi:ribonuclease VapC
MPEKKKNLLDSFALLAFLNKESGFEKVRSLLREAQRSSEPLLMNEINIGEVYYITAKERSFELADDFLNRLETLSIQTVPNSFADVLDAARLKAHFPIAYADAFAAATAIRMNAVIVTGDPEFRRIEHLTTINWL